jgi:hypothetical protein
MPDLFSLYPQTEDGSDNLPDAATPYYVLAKDGLFLHKKTQIGSVLVKEPTMPPHINLGTIGHKNGLFTWIGPKIPAHIISQALDLFRRTYEKHHTEAEVLLTMHNETGVIRIFVPYQRVSGGGVKSVFEPTHIDPNYTIVGTIHSHCMMNAFHSGTDSSDASDMDGVHLTMGKVMDNPPEIVAMVAMNGTEFHYKDPAIIAELDYDVDTAPLWWDQFIFPASTETAKPKGLKTITQQQWDEFRGLAQPKPKIIQPSYGYKPQPHQPYKGSEDNNWGSGYISRLLGAPSRITKESEEFNRKRNRTLPMWTPDGNHQFHETPESLQIDMVIDHAIEQGALQSADWTKILASEMDDLSFWKHFFLNKLDILCEVLELAGLTINYEVKDPE